MIPARHSEGGSRRSSILKPSKHRQPLQCVVINPASSSSETTPITTKIQRRVSFAEKKHVKEFCDSFEQGTVWDNTYEENDSSHQKAVHSGNFDEDSSTSRNTNTNIKSSINSIEKENYPLNIQIYEDHHQLNTHFEIAPVTPFCDDFQPNLQSDVYESSAMDTDIDLPNVLICTNVMQNSNKTMSKEISPQEKSLGCNPSLDVENVSTAFYSKSRFQNTIYDNETMAFTKILPSVTQNVIENTFVHQNAEERTESVIHNLSKDATEAVPNYIYLKARELNCAQICFQETEAQEDDGMEVTGESESENESQNGTTNETKLNDISMEMTTAIPSVRLQTSVEDGDDDNEGDESETDNFARRNLSMEMTSVVPSIPIRSQDHFSDLMQVHKDDERTWACRNSMEFTIAVPSCFENPDAFQSVQLNTGGVLSQNKSMEFFAVGPISLPKKTAESRDLEDKSTRLFRSKSMECTTVVPSSFSKQTAESTVLEDNSTRPKSIELITVVPSIFSAKNTESRDLEKNIGRLVGEKLVEFTAIVPSSLSVESSLNLPNSNEISEKRRRLSIPEMELSGTESPTIGYQSNFENCNHIGVEQTLRRSDGIGLLNMELTEPLLRNPSPEAYFPSQFETLNRQSISNVNETISRASFIVKNNLIMPDFQEKVLNDYMSVSQVFALPLSPCYSFLDKLRTKNKIKNTGLGERDAGSIIFSFSDNKENAVLEEEVIKGISGLDVMNEVLNIPEKIKRVTRSGDKAKDVEEVNGDVGNRNCISDNDSSVDLRKSKDKINNFFLEINSRIIENEEPPSFLNQSISDDNADEDLKIENVGLTKSQEVLNIQKKDLKEVLRMTRKRSYEASGIRETENQAEESLKRCSFKKIEKQANSPELANLIKITESTKTVVKGEKPKGRTELERTLLSEKALVIADSNTSINRFQANVASLEKVSEKKSKKRNSSESSTNVSENSIISIGNSLSVNENSTCETGVNFNNRKDKNSIKEGHNRRYAFVMNKDISLHSQNENRIVEESSILEDEDYHKRNNVSCEDSGTTKENSSLPLCETEIKNETEKNLNENINKVNFLQYKIHHESVTNFNVSEDISCAEMEIEIPLNEIGDLQNQVFICEEINQYELRKNGLKMPTEEDPFCVLVDNIRSNAQRNDCIWDVRFLNKKMLSFNFISKSLVVIIDLRSQGEASLKEINDIQIKSLLPDAKQDLIRIVHDLILNKVHPGILLESYKLYEDVLPLLAQFSKEVKLALDFVFELEQLKDLNLIQIDTKGILFVTRTKRMDIVLEITVNIKPFDEINVDDINVKSLLGSISINEVKQLIMNVRRDHTFLRRFINDVKDYVELMEESAAVGK